MELTATIPVGAAKKKRLPVFVVISGVVAIVAAFSYHIHLYDLAYWPLDQP
jgi:hypothetical protein